MATEKFAAFTDRGAVIGSGLNSLADGAYSAAGTEVNNASNLDRYGVAELVVTFGSSPTANSTCDLYFVSAPDGTNYEDGGGSTAPSPVNYLGSFVLRAVTDPQRLTTPMFEIPPAKVKFVLRNGSGQSFPASGSEVSLYTTNRTII